MAERTMTVTGRGRSEARPDMISFAVSLKTIDKDYQKMMEASAVKLNALYLAMEGAGVARRSVKTADYRIDAEYENVRDAKGEWRQEFKGFYCAQALRIELPFDMTKLGLALAAIATCSAEPNLSIRFSVKDAGKMHDEAIASAVADAHEKAKLLASASGARLGALRSVNYTRCEGEIFSPTQYVRSAKMCDMSANAVEIEPEDASVEDTVTMAWEIEG